MVTVIPPPRPNVFKTDQIYLLHNGDQSQGVEFLTMQSNSEHRIRSKTVTTLREHGIEEHCNKNMATGSSYFFEVQKMLFQWGMTRRLTDSRGHEDGNSGPCLTCPCVVPKLTNRLCPYEFDYWYLYE